MNKKIKKSLFGIIFLMSICLAGKGFSQAEVEFFDPVDNTGINRPIKVNFAVINGDTLESGDEIAVFDDTLCVGACKVDTFPLVFSSILQVKTPTDTLPGAIEGHSMTFRIWHKDSESEIDGIPAYERGGIFGDYLTVCDSIYAIIGEITFTTNPAGLSYFIDGKSYTGEHKLLCNVDSSYTLSVTRYQDESNGSRSRFNWWSDGNDTNRVHIYTGPSSNETVTVHFMAQHYLTVNSIYGNPTGEGWYDVGSNRAFAVDSTVAGDTGVRYVFTGWTGDGTGSYTGDDTLHTVTINNPISEDASWKTQYVLLTAEVPDEGGDITLDPVGDPPENWYDSSTMVTVTTDTADNYQFTGWSGDKTGSNNPVILTMNAPKSLTANYVKTVQCTLQTNPAGLDFIVDGSTYSESQVFTWLESSNHTLSVDSPQDGVTGTRYVFTSWSDAGASTHIYTVSGLIDTVSITANFKTQHLLTLNSDHGYILGGGWIDEGVDTTFAVYPDTVSGGTGIRYIFDGWTGTGSSSYTGPDTSYILTMNGPVTETADWDTLYYLTTLENPDGGGTMTPSPPGAWYDIGTEVILDTVSLATGRQWCGWTGDITGKTLPETITMDGPRSVIANFGKEVRVSVQTNPSELGFKIDTVSYTAPYTFTWIADSAYSVNALDSTESDTTTRYMFNSWSDGGGRSHEYIVPDSDDTVILSATYITQHYLNIISEYDSPSGEGWYDKGDNASFSVDLIVSGSNGIRYVFDGWTGSGAGAFTGGDSSATVVMDNPISEEATWKVQYRLTVNSNHGAPWGEGWYEEGGDANFGVDSTESIGQGIREVFNGWTGSGTGSYTGADTAHTITMNNPVTEDAAWNLQYFLTINKIPDEGGIVDPPSPGAWYNSGVDAEIDTVSVTADYQWGGWSGDASGTGCPVIVTMNAPKNVYALFGETAFCVIKTEPPDLGFSAGGIIYSDTTTFQWLKGSTHIVSVNSIIEKTDVRYIFNSWSDGGIRSHVYTVPVTKDVDTLTVYFDTEYRLIVNSEYSTTVGEGWYAEGSIAYFRILDNQIENNNIRYKFKEWNGTGLNSYSGEESSYYVTVTNSITETAVWETLYKLTTSVNIDTAGSIVREPDKEWYNHGETVKLTATPCEDGSYIFDLWTGDIGSNDPAENPLNLFMDSPKNISVDFEGVYHTLTKVIDPSSDCGSIYVRPEKNKFIHTSEISVEAVAKSGYCFSHWGGAVSGTALIADFNIISDATVTAYFDTLDTIPPVVTDCYPPKNAVMVPVNSGLEFSVIDGVYGVNRQTIDVTVMGTQIIKNGNDQTSGLVSINAVNKGYKIIYDYTVSFDTSAVININIKCKDTAREPNTLNYSYKFTTGLSKINYLKTDTVSQSARTIEHSSGVIIEIPANAVLNSVVISIGYVVNPPAFPDTVNGVGLTFFFRPEGLQFLKPVTVKIPKDSLIMNKAGVFSEDDLKVYTFSTNSGKWEEIKNISYDQTHVIFTINHFSYFGLASWKQAMKTPDNFVDIYNYPNPFNPDLNQTFIRYILSKSLKISIKIYDISGELVRVVIDDESKTKMIEYQCEWDGRNGNGEIVANNVYFCVVESSSGKRVIRKIAVLR